MNILKCKAHLKTKFKCVCVTMCSLVMSPFSRDYMKMEIYRPNKVSAMFYLIYMCTEFTQRLVLDGRTSTC